MLYNVDQKFAFFRRRKKLIFGKQKKQKFEARNIFFRQILKPNDFFDAKFSFFVIYFPGTNPQCALQKQQGFKIGVHQLQKNNKLEKRNFTFVNEDGDGDYFVLGFRVYGIIFCFFLGFRVYGFVFRF